MKLTKNIEAYVQSRINEFISSTLIAEEKLAMDTREKIRDCEKILNKELSTELPKLIDALCKVNHIDTEMYTVNVKDIDVSVRLNRTATPLKKRMFTSNVFHTKILVKLEMEKSYDMETIDHIINSVLYPKSEVKSTVEENENVESSSKSEEAEI